MSGFGPRLDAVISRIDDIEKAGVHVATSPLQQRAHEVRANRVNWQSYLQGQMISQEDYDFITHLDNSTPEQRAHLLRERSHQCAKTFLNLMGHIAKDQTVQYILTMIDDMLQEDKSRVEIFRDYARKHKESVWTPFLNMLNRPDPFIENQTGRILAKIACWSKEPMEGADLQYYLTWLKDQLKSPFEVPSTDVTPAPNNEYLQTVARCLQMMLRIDKYRHAFLRVDGISTVISVLAGKVGFQIQYQLTFCLWCMTFNPELTQRMNKYNVIPILADILSESAKEKVTRIILATFRNLLEKPTEVEITQDHALSMVQCKVLKQLQLLEGRKFEDEDITEDIKYLSETLQASVQDLSSFDEYSSEVKSGRLEWSPVHKADRFWRENAPRLNEKNYELLKILIKLLETSRDPLILSVANHDIGEYVRHYPRGKHTIHCPHTTNWRQVMTSSPVYSATPLVLPHRTTINLHTYNVIEQLGGKQLVMQHLSHEDPNVRYEALLAVQKLMVHNWEYLGKALVADRTHKEGSVGTAKA